MPRVPPPLSVGTWGWPARSPQRTAAGRNEGPAGRRREAEGPPGRGAHKSKSRPYSRPSRAEGRLPSVARPRGAGAGPGPSRHLPRAERNGGPHPGPRAARRRRLPLRALGFPCVPSAAAAAAPIGARRDGPAGEETPRRAPPTPTGGRAPDVPAAAPRRETQRAPAHAHTPRENRGGRGEPTVARPRGGPGKGCPCGGLGGPLNAVQPPFFHPAPAGRRRRGSVAGFQPRRPRRWEDGGRRGRPGRHRPPLGVPEPSPRGLLDGG